VPANRQYERSQGANRELSNAMGAAHHIAQRYFPVFLVSVNRLGAFLLKAYDIPNPPNLPKPS